MSWTHSTTWRVMTVLQAIWAPSSRCFQTPRSAPASPACTRWKKSRELTTAILSKSTAITRSRTMRSIGSSLRTWGISEAASRRTTTWDRSNWTRLQWVSSHWLPNSHSGEIWRWASGRACVDTWKRKWMMTWTTPISCLILSRASLRRKLSRISKMTSAWNFCSWTGTGNASIPSRQICEGRPSHKALKMMYLPSKISRGGSVSSIANTWSTKTSQNSSKSTHCSTGRSIWARERSPCLSSAIWWRSSTLKYK